MRKLLILFFTLERQGKSQTPSCSLLLLRKDLARQEELGLAGDNKAEKIRKSADQALITCWGKADVQ